MLNDCPVPNFGFAKNLYCELVQKWSISNQTLPTQLNSGHHAQYALLHRFDCKIRKYLKFHKLRHFCKQQIRCILFVCLFVCLFLFSGKFIHTKKPNCSLYLHYCFILGSNIWALTSISQNLLGLSFDWMRERKIIWNGNSHNLQKC